MEKTLIKLEKNIKSSKTSTYSKLQISGQSAQSFLDQTQIKFGIALLLALLLIAIFVMINHQPFKQPMRTDKQLIFDQILKQKLEKINDKQSINIKNESIYLNEVHHIQQIKLLPQTKDQDLVSKSENKLIKQTNLRINS